MTGQLKSQTALLHSEVEELMYAAPIMDRTLTIDQLVHLLRIHHRFHVMLEQWLGPHEKELKALKIWPLERSPLIEGDLVSCGAEAPIAPEVVGPIGLPGMLGVLYVSEGSMLGGAVIAKALAAHPDLRHLPMDFFKAYGPDLRQHWITLCEQLNARPGSERPEILEGAIMAFETYKQCSSAVHSWMYLQDMLEDNDGLSDSSISVQ